MTPFGQSVEAMVDMLRYWASPPGLFVNTYWRKTLQDVRADSPYTVATVEQIVQELQMAEPYYVAADIGDFLLSATKTLPSCVLRDEDTVDCLHGWLYLEKPIPFDVGNGWGSLRAISWCPKAKEPNSPDGDVIDPGLAVIYYGHRPGETRLLPQSCMFWPMAEPWDDWTPGAGVSPDAHKHLAMIRALLLVFFYFIHQHVLVPERQRVDRATRRRMERASPVTTPIDPSVRVVALRRRANSSEHHGEGSAVEWSCRWLVRGHWRQQWYAHSQEHRPTFILPHVKGPEDKPLRAPRPTIFAVVR